MPVTEVLRGLGSWDLMITERLSDEKWKLIDYFGHIVIHVGPRPGALDDSLLKSARYVGPVTTIKDNGSQRSIGGAGMSMWLGDGEGKGDVFTEAITVAGDYDDVIRDLLPASGAITEGTFFNIAGTWPSSTFQFQTPRDVIDYVAQTIGGAWRVNGDGTLDFGLESDLFIVNPKCIVVRKGLDDMFLRGLAGTAETERDVDDYTTAVVLLAQGINGQFVSAEEELDPGEIPFVDIHGNTIRRARIIQESETDPSNAPARAQLQLNRFKGTRDALTLSTSDYDVKGKAQPGDYIWTYDPTMKLVDINNEVPYRGKRINPYKLQLTETTWPVTARMTVLYRAGSGEWADITKGVIPETGDTTLVVGGYNRSLSADSSSGAFPITLPDVNTTIPDQVEWDLPWTQSQYQSAISGETKSEVQLKWLRPDNTDASTITDGAYYEIRFRQSGTPLTDYTMQELDDITSDVSDLNTAQYPIITGIEDEWQFIQAPFESLSYRLQELTPGVTYEAQVRAVDNGRPPNLGDWSALEQWQASRDVFPPATPAPPEVAASTIAVLITHKLGRADGGEFNLDRDLNHLNVYSGSEPLFTPTDANLIGKVVANWGNLTGNIPVVARFQTPFVTARYYKVVAVDQSGNQSLPSQAVVATAALIDDMYIGTLNVAKLISGTITASIVNSGLISTGGSGARVDLTSEGIKGYNSLAQMLIDWSNEQGKITVHGRGGIEIIDGALLIKNAAGQVIVEAGECLDGRHGIQVYDDDGSIVARMGELASGSPGVEVVNDFNQTVRVSSLAFGTQASTVTATQNRIGTAFGDMITVGPSVTVQVGNTGRMIVMVGAWCNNTADAISAAASFDVAGPGGYFSGSNFFRSVRVDAGSVSGDLTAIGATKVFLVDGLNPGSNTITMKYSSNSSTDLAQFSDRHLVAFPF